MLRIENLIIGVGMLIDGFYTEEINGIFCIIPSEKLEKVLNDNAIEKFKRKNQDYKVDIFMSFKSEFLKEKGQEYFNALSSVIRSKYQTKKYVENKIKENIKIYTQGSFEEKEYAFKENIRLYDLTDAVVI